MHAELCRNYLRVVCAVLDTNVAKSANVASKPQFKRVETATQGERFTVYNTNVANIAKVKA